MGFNAPVAFLALGTLLILLLFSFWKRRPVERVVGSLRLWKEIPDQATPLKTAKKPRISISLLLQALTLTLIVVALASPFLFTTVREPREIFLVVDTSARLEAEGSTASTRFATGIERAKALSEELDRYDSVTVLAHLDHPRSWTVNGEELRRFLPKLKPVQYRVDLSALIPASRSKREFWVLSDRPVKDALLLPAAGPVDNTGITHVSLSEGVLFVRLVRSGTPAKITLEVEAGGAELKQVSMTLEAGVHRWSGRIRPGDTDRVSVSIREKDSLLLDNIVWLNRHPFDAGVTYRGRDHALLLRVLQSMPGIRLGRAGCMVSYRDASPVDGPAVFVDPPSAPAGFRLGREFVPGSWNVSDHRLMRHVRTGDLEASSAREVIGGEPLLHADGKCVAAIQGNRIVLGFDLLPSGWCTTPSFPIFWTNVFEFVTTSSSWKTFRTGEPITGGKEIPGLVGEFSIGGRSVGVSLLDSRESDLKPVGAFSKGEKVSGREVAGQEPLTGFACLLALIFALLSWWSDRAGR